MGTYLVGLELGMTLGGLVLADAMYGNACGGESTGSPHCEANKGGRIRGIVWVHIKLLKKLESSL